MTEEQGSTVQRMHRWVAAVGLFVAPTTLITGLCYFFGSVYTRQRLEYFAVDPQSLGFTTADYVVMNVSVFFFPVIRVLLVCAVLVWAALAIHGLAKSGRHTREIRIAAVVAIVIAVAGLGVGLSWLWFEYPELSQPIMISTLIGGGMTLLVAGYWMLLITRGSGRAEGARSFAVAEQASLGVAVAVIIAALFWITDVYAAEQGKKRGAYAADHLWDKEIGVVLGTDEPLDLPDDLSGLLKVTTDPSTAQDGRATYRYECLRALEVRNNRWVLVPAKWTREHGFALTVTPDSANRIITRPVDAAATGKNPNVYPYWNCPEAVRTFEGSELSPMLLDPAEVQQRTGLARLALADNAAPAETTAATDTCARAADPDPTAAFRDSGNTGGTGRKLAGAQASSAPWVTESVVPFQNPARAADFVLRTRRDWLHCTGTIVQVANGGVVEERKLGGVGEGDGVVALDSATAGQPGGVCSRAIAAKSNVVVDVHLCRSDGSADAVSLVKAIRDRIPN